MSILKIISKPLPTKRNNRRVWIETKKLHDTNFTDSLSYDYSIDHKTKTLTLTPSLLGRKITLRKNNTPVIDINNAEMTSLFEGIDKVNIIIFTDKIVIKPLKEEMQQSRAREKLKRSKHDFIDVFAGAGTLTEAFKKHMKPSFAVELEKKYVDMYEVNNPNTTTYNTSVTEMDVDLLPDSSVVIGGVPCEDYSIAGISKKKSMGKGVKEAGITGSLGYFFLKVVEAVRPAYVVIEEVPGFGTSGMRDIVVSTLKAYGYNILMEKILRADDFGSMTNRRRYCLVCQIDRKDGVVAEFDFILENATAKRSAKRSAKTVGSILEIPLENRHWLTPENSATLRYTLSKEIADKKAGKGFRIGRTLATDTSVVTISKGYYKFRTTDPILVDPQNPNRFSQFTPRELARIHGLPDDYILPASKTPAGEIIGQGVAQEPFEAVARAIIKDKGINYVN